MRKAGMGRSSTRLGMELRTYRPAVAFFQVSREGVADPKTQAAPKPAARITATSRPWYIGVSPCLNEGSCSSSTTMRRRLGKGAKTAERAPTTTRACPRDMAIHASNRSPAERWLCQTTTLAPRSVSRDRSRPTVWGVKATSGTRKIAEPPSATTLRMSAT